MSLEGHPLPSPPPDSNVRSLREHMSGLFSRTRADKIASNVFSDPPDSEGESAGRKRVGFRPWTTNILEPQLSTPDSEVPPSLRSLPPSRDCQLTVRPILKPSLSAQSVLSLDGQNEKISTIDSMDSLLRNLAVNERSSSVDAYQTMTTLIKIYDVPPEQDILQKKMVQLQKYIKRDLVVLDTNLDGLPSEDRLSMGNLVLTALKVLVTIVWSPVYSPCLSDDFRAWSVDRAIRVLKEKTAQKAVLLHYIHLIATQDFRPSIMTRARIHRILDELKDLAEHISGKAVLAERLLAYQKLIQQSKQIMKDRADLWTKNVFTAMGHSFKEVRSNAVSVGTEACSAYSGAGSITTAARAALAEVHGDRSLSVSITNRLERILAAKDEANQIPQIWTLVLLLCNAGGQKIDTWPELPDWLKLIQRCFNSSEMSVRVQAFLAWNRLYYVARPHEASEKVVSMLAKPAMVQLDKTGNAQSSKGTRQAVISSYCMLLYYAFRPSATPQQYTRMWNEFVVKLMTRSFLSKSAANCDLSSRILASLFHSSLSKSRVWNENRAHENAALDPLELPAIDCKWIRSKTPSILAVFRLTVFYSSFGPSGLFSEQAYAPQAWRHLMRAIKESTTKEVKSPPEMVAAMSSIVQFLRPVDHELDAADVDFQEYAKRLDLLAKITIEELGLTSILQALENRRQPGDTILLRCLVQHLMQPTIEVSRRLSAQDQSVVECLRFLKEDLNFVVGLNADISQSTRDAILLYTSYTIELFGEHQSLQALIKLQDPIASLVQDSNKQFSYGVDTANNDSAHTYFCTKILGLCHSRDGSEQEQIGMLVSAAKASTHAWIREYVSEKSIEPDTPQEDLIALGPINGLGALNTHFVSEDSTGRLIQTEHVGSTPKMISSGSKSTASKSRKTKSKPQHGNSRIEFVPVQSSPIEYTVESQLLTTRQKEVRARQTAGPAVTFDNIGTNADVNQISSKSATQSDRQSTPELPGTPTLPLRRSTEDEVQPPTPTPKARKCRRLNLQPEVPSSPPSNAGDEPNLSGIHITSSPVKEPVEADDALSFEDLSRGDNFHENEASMIVSDQPQDGAHVVGQGSPNEQQIAPSKTEHDPAPVASTSEEYETARLDKSSPSTYSDEFDALAASQLSQTLEETSFMSSHFDSQEVVEPPRSTRKRKSAQQISTTSRKRRRSSPIHETEVVESTTDRPEILDDEAENTIYVSVEKSSPCSPRVTRARAAQEASDMSQISQASSASNTPRSKKSKGSRRPGRPKKKLRGRRSQDTLPDSPVAEVQGEACKADIEMANVNTEASFNSPSLGSEVGETEDSKSEPPEIVTEPVVDHRPASPEIFATDHDVLKTDEMPSEVPGPRSDGLARNVIDRMRIMLSALDTASAKDVVISKEELAEIHSLCFRVGLKAQEIASGN